MRWNLRILNKAICGWIAAIAIASCPRLAVAESAQFRAAGAEELTIIVPGASGGGWDLTAKAMKQVLVAEGIARDVKIVRYPGVGGLVGISQFSARYRNNSNALMVGGLVMVGSSMRDEAAVTLRDVSAVARLTGDWQVIAVPMDSEIRTVADMRAVLTAKPELLSWVGGALGGPDQAVVWRIAAALGVSLDDVLYFSKPGGQRVGEALAQGAYPIGVSGYAEFEPYIRQGKIRVLTVAAPHRLPGVAAPTLRESGIDVSIMNWRGVFAPPGLDAAQQDRLLRIIEAMRSSTLWQTALARRNWGDIWLAGDQFTQFIAREQVRWSGILNPVSIAKTQDISLPSRVPPLDWLQAILVLIIATSALLGIRLRFQWKAFQFQAAELKRECTEFSGQIEKMKTSTKNFVKEGVDEDFGEWNLSTAESDIAWFMLRGLPLKQIATLRGTSERTVRQQAQAIYRKAGLEGRCDLAGRVLERFI